MTPNPRRGVAGRASASRLAREGNHHDAIALLDEMLADAPTPAEFVEASRMKAQNLAALQDADAATRAMEDALAVYEQTPGLIDRLGPAFDSLANQLALAWASQGRIDDALALSARLLEPATWRAEHSIETAHVNHAAILARAGRHTEAAATLERLFAWKPEFGMDSGVAVDLRVNMAQYRDPTGVSEAFRRELAGLWNDPSLADFPQSVRVAERLAQAQADAGDTQGRLETLSQLVARIEARAAAWSRPAPGSARQPAMLEALRRSRTSALSVLSSADAYGRHDLALDAIARLRADAREPHQFATLDRMEEAVRLRLAGGR